MYCVLEIEVATVTNSGARMKIIIAAVIDTSSHAAGPCRRPLIGQLRRRRSRRRTEAKFTASTIATSTVAHAAPNGQL